MITRTANLEAGTAKLVEGFTFKCCKPLTMVHVTTQCYLLLCHFQRVISMYQYSLTAKAIRSHLLRHINHVSQMQD